MSLVVSQNLSVYDTDGASTALACTDLVDVALKTNLGTIVTAMCVFGRYVPMSVINGVLTGRITATLGMHLCPAVVTFQDIESFTALCERYRDFPNMIVELVAPVFEAVSNIIMANKGTIDKYIGDCIMSFWQVGVGGPAMACCHAVQALLESLSVEPASDERSPRGGSLIRFRSGAHFGETLLGNFGSCARFNYTVIGDVVNTAARMEPLNKEVHSRTLISEDVFSEIPSEHALKAHLRYVGTYALIGKALPMRVYELQNEAMDGTAHAQWHSMMVMVDKGDFVGALAILDLAMKAMDPGRDAVAEELVLMMTTLRSERNAEPWDGVRKQRKK